MTRLKITKIALLETTVSKYVQFLNVPKGCADGFKGCKNVGSQLMLMSWWVMGRG